MFKEMWTRITRHFKASDNNQNGAKMPEENSATLPMLSDIDVTLLSEEEISTLREVFERQWAQHEMNDERKRKLEKEIKEIEEKIAQKVRVLSRKAIAELCIMCFKVKIASTSALVCKSCRKKACPKCGKSDQGKWRCALCLKKRARLIYTGAWYNDAESRDRSQVQDILNKLAEESIRRMEMAIGNRQEEPAVSLSCLPYNPGPPRLLHVPAAIDTNKQKFRLHVNQYKGATDDDGGDDDDDDDDDDVFEDDNEGLNKYLSIPHQEEQNQGVMFESSSSEVDGVFADESQGAVGGECSTATVCHELENRSSKRKVAVTTMANDRGLRPLIQKVSLRKDSRFYGGFGSGSEFGIKVVGGKMCTGGFNGVHVAKVTRGSPAEKCIKEGDQILEWNHVSMVDVSFEQVRRIVADSPQDVTLVVCHNTARPQQSSRERIELAMHWKRKGYESIQRWSRWSLAQLMEHECTFDEGEVKTQAAGRTRGQIQLHLWHDSNGNNMIVRVLRARGLSLQHMPNQELPNPYVLLYLLPNREITSQYKTNTDPQTVTPKWDLSFMFSNISEDELTVRALEVTLWSENHTKGHTFLGEVLIKLTPEFLHSGAQCTWFDLMDHDDSTFSFPVPMTRRHSNPSLEKDEIELILLLVLYGSFVHTPGAYSSLPSGTLWWKNSDTGWHMPHRRLSAVDLSRSDLQVPSHNSQRDTTLHHAKQRRVAATAETFRPKQKFSFGGISDVEEWKKNYSEYKCKSEPCTPCIMSAQGSTEDLTPKRSSSEALDTFLKLPALTLSEYLAQNKLPDAKPDGQELDVREEKEGKTRKTRIIKAMKRFQFSYHKSEPTVNEGQKLGATGQASSRSKEEGHHRALSSPSKFSTLNETEQGQQQMLAIPRIAKHRSSPSTELPVETEAEKKRPMRTLRRFHFSYHKSEPTGNEGQQLGVTNQYSSRPKEEGHHRSLSSPSKILTLNETEQGQQQMPPIPRIAIHRSNSSTDASQFSAALEEPTPVETEAEKKGPMRTLRRISKHLRPRPSLYKQDLYGEDPDRGATGPGQIRRESHQDLGYIRIGLSALHGTLEVEIIRAFALLVPTDHFPDTYVKTYLIENQIRLLKRKTSITRQSGNPLYNCKIKYPGGDFHNKELLVSVWCKQGIFGRNLLLGEARVALGSLNLGVKQVSWYKLFIECQLSDDD